MSLLSRLVPRTAKGILLSAACGLILLAAAWQGLRAWWLHGFSIGERTGFVRKFSYKGSPLCKYWSGELALVSSGAGAQQEIWTFTVDDPREQGPLVQAIQAGEASARPVTLKYRQDKGKWWACAPTEYYVTAVVAAPR